MIITIQGPAGSGKGSIAKLLAKKLGYKHYSTGDFRRMRAKELGMTIEEFNKLGEKESFTDQEADDWQRQLGLKEDNFVIDCRTGFYFIPHSIKVYIGVSDDVAAQRIFNDKSPDRLNAQKSGSLEEQKRLSMERNASDALRYKKHYGIDDYTDPKHYDFVMDTSHESNIEKNAQKIVDFLLSKRLISAHEIKTVV